MSLMPLWDSKKPSIVIGILYRKLDTLGKAVWLVGCARVVYIFTHNTFDLFLRFLLHHRFPPINLIVHTTKVLKIGNSRFNCLCHNHNMHFFLKCYLYIILFILQF